MERLSIEIKEISENDVLELKLLRDSLRQEMQMSKSLLGYPVTMEQARLARLSYDVVEKILKGVKEE